MARTLFDRIWETHLVGRRADGRDLVYIDRQVCHELQGPHALEGLIAAGRGLRRPDLTFGITDHTVPSRPDRVAATRAAGPDAHPHLHAMRAGRDRFGFRLFDIDDPEQGISHVVAPELGIVLPGSTYACPDSHACTLGGIGALAFGCVTSEMEHILATQVLALRRPQTMRVTLDGRLGPGVSAKDAMLRVIAQCGLDAGRGHAVEYAGPAVRALPVEGRLTLCNMAIEMGARSGLIAPDDSVYGWLADRPYAPQGAQWDAAVGWWRTLRSDDAAAFDREATVDCEGLEPQVTWGTDPSQSVGVSGHVPDPATAAPERRAALARALDYMDLRPGMAVAGLAVNRVFIGSCTNARLSDLESAAAVLRGRKVAPGVSAMVVPGSTGVKRDAEARGLDRIFRDAGFAWAESACSMCTGGNGDRGESGERIVSTTNRNFEGRQGAGVRTHLASPAMAAAAAVTGRITDVRRLLDKTG